MTNRSLSYSLPLNNYSSHRSRRKDEKSVFMSAKRPRTIACNTGRELKIEIENFLDGEHSRHTAPDQVDPQHRADHQSNANGGCLQDAQSTAACAGGTAVRRFDEQGSRFVAKTDGSEISSTSRCPPAPERVGPNYQHRQGTLWSVEHEPVSG